jgi:TatD DNase family protein
MSVTLHDTHFHLDLQENPEQIVREIERERIYTIAVTNIPGVFNHTHTLVIGCKYIKGALGFHPELSHQYHRQIDQFRELVGGTRYIGEVGLDNYNKPPSDYATQKRVFEQVISASHEAHNKILTVHSRRAEAEVISMIGNGFSGKVILHWYSGKIKDMDRAIDCGFYFSVNYAMTLSDNGKKIIDAIPAERMLLETDGPFVKVNGKLSTPLATALTLERIIELKQDIGVSAAIQSNFKRLLQ